MPRRCKNKLDTFVSVHRFLVLSKFPINNIYDLDYSNILSPTPLLEEHVNLKGRVFDIWDNSHQFLVSFQNRLYYGRGAGFSFSKSWDLKTGELATHQTLVEEYVVYDFAFIEVNGKIWRTGGWSQEDGVAVKSTHFLHQNFTWTRGPDLPYEKESHTMVAISETEIIIFGGNLLRFAKESANKIWIYNDIHQNFTRMKDFQLGSYPSAIKSYIEDIKKEALIVMIRGKVYFYDWPYDSWIESGGSWIHPVPQFERIKFFTWDERFAF